MNFKQLLKKRDFLLLSASAVSVMKLSVNLWAAAKLGNIKFPGLNAELAKFLEQTKEQRRHFRGGTIPDKGTIDLIALEVEKSARFNFQSLASKGSRRHQFYLGKILAELHLLTDKASYRELAVKWFKAAEAQGHPDATTEQIKSLPNATNKLQYLKAIKLGSVSALANCSGYTLSMLESKDWMKAGPEVSFPEQAGVSWWSEVFTNWMIIYHYLIQWDRKGMYFRLSLPNNNLMGIMLGQYDPAVGYEEKFGIDLFRECTSKAASHACSMDVDFFPEEIYDAAWDKIFLVDP